MGSFHQWMMNSHRRSLKMVGGQDFTEVALKLLLVEVCRNQCMCWVAYVVRLSNHCK